MKYIDNGQLRKEAELLNWDTIKQKHSVNMKQMLHNDRKKYISNNPDWNLFQKIMLQLSTNKCWYTEAPIGSSDFEVDHFRPKNKSKEKKDYKQNQSKSIVHKKNGYWWLAYDYFNYRLSGGLSNKRRRDRLRDCEEVKGKGDYFPLDLTSVGRVADDETNTNCEIPILLDPCKLEDVSLLTFDSNGEPISNGETDYEHNRVHQSIFYYHLDLEQLNRERLQAWKDCEREIKEAKQEIDESPDERQKRKVMEICLTRIKDYVKSPKRCYTSTIKACINVHAESNGYTWLKRFRDTILL